MFAARHSSQRHLRAAAALLRPRASAGGPTRTCGAAFLGAPPLQRMLPTRATPARTFASLARFTGGLSAASRPLRRPLRRPVLLTTARGLTAQAVAHELKVKLKNAEGAIPILLTALDYIGTAAFAAAGTLVAGETGMDTLGCLIVGTITAIGGGTARDILLGRLPVFWFTQTSYIWLCIATVVATFYFDDTLERAGLLHDQVLFWGDTLGLGAFCVVGAQAAMAMGRGPLICIMCGGMTATCGGLIRDVLCSRRPNLLFSPEPDSPVDQGTLYGTAALIGAAVFVGVMHAGTMMKMRPQAVSAAAIALGAGAGMFLRVWSVVYVVRLKPMGKFRSPEGVPELNRDDTHMMVTAFGADQVGLIAALTSRFAEGQANISASKIVTIGDDIASMMVVSAPKREAENLRQGLNAIAKELRLQLSIHDVQLSPPPVTAKEIPQYRGKVRLVGPDRPGIMREVSAFTADHSLNISSLDTRVYAGDAPETTAVLRNGGGRSSNDEEGNMTFMLDAVVTTHTVPDTAKLAKDAEALRPLQLSIEWMADDDE